MVINIVLDLSKVITIYGVIEIVLVTKGYIDIVIITVTLKLQWIFFFF